MLQYAKLRAVPMCLAVCPGSSSGLAGQLWEDSQGPWPTICPAGYLCDLSHTGLFLIGSLLILATDAQHSPSVQYVSRKEIWSRSHFAWGAIQFCPSQNIAPLSSNWNYKSPLSKQGPDLKGQRGRGERDVTLFHPH